MAPQEKASDAVFWERIADMPAWEAEQECVLRRESLVLENSMPNGEAAKASLRDRKAIGVAIAENNALLSKLLERIKYLRKLQDRVQWREAVRELYGDEAVESCIVYMEQRWADVSEKRKEWAAK